MNKLYYCVMVSLLVVPEPATFLVCGVLTIVLLQEGLCSIIAAANSAPSALPTSGDQTDHGAEHAVAELEERSLVGQFGPLEVSQPDAGTVSERSGYVVGTQPGTIRFRIADGSAVR